MHFVFICIVVVPIITATVRDNITDGGVSIDATWAYGPDIPPDTPPHNICFPMCVCKHDWKFDHSCTRRAHKSASESSGFPAFEALGYPKDTPQGRDIPCACWPAPLSRVLRITPTLICKRSVACCVCVN